MKLNNNRSHTQRLHTTDTGTEVPTATNSTPTHNGAPFIPRSRPKSLGKAALDYVKRGWHVMPIAADGEKKPSVKWKPYQTEQPDAATVTRWFNHQFPRANIGLITGETCGVIVVDADSPEALEWIEAHNPPRGPVAQSSKDYKRHFYFKHPGFRIKTSQSEIHPNVDVRGDGGCAVLPPSIHHTGVAYKWIVPPDEAELPDAPDWLLEAIIQNSKPERDVDVVPAVPIRDSDPNAPTLRKYTDAALNGEVQNVANAPDGTKHATVRDAAVKLAGFIPHGLLSAQEIEGHLFGAVAGRAKDKRNAHATIKDGIRYGSMFPRDLSKVLQPSVKHPLLNGGHLNGNHHAEPLSVSKSLETAEPDTSLIEDRAEFPISNLAQIFERPRALWLIQGILLEMGYSALTGGYGTFKSFLALDMGLCITTGTAWHGREVKRGTVVYVVAEGAYTTADRARAWLIRHQLPIPENFHVIEMPVRIGDTFICVRFIEAIRDLNPDFIILDTLAKCNVGKDENSSAEMGLFTDGMEKCARELNAQVLTIHHNNKQGTARGSNSLPSNVDTHITVKAASGYIVTVECEKQKGVPFEKFSLVGNIVELGEVDEYGTPVTSLVFALTYNTPQEREVIASIGKAEKSREEVLKVLQHFEGGASNQKWQDACAHIVKRAAFLAHRNALENQKQIYRADNLWHAGTPPEELDLSKSPESPESPEMHKTGQTGHRTIKSPESPVCPAHLKVLDKVDKLDLVPTMQKKADDEEEGTW